MVEYEHDDGPAKIVNISRYQMLHVLFNLGYNNGTTMRDSIATIKKRLYENSVNLVHSTDLQAIISSIRNILHYSFCNPKLKQEKFQFLRGVLFDYPNFQKFQYVSFLVF